jgi:DNA polymerase-3 subunit delta
MQLKPQSLDAHLKSNSLPIYLICGDEPMQKTEALDKLTKHHEQQGAERQLLFVESGFNWSEFLQHAYSSGMFAERQLLVLYLRQTPDRAAQKHLLTYLNKLNENATVIILAPKIDRTKQKASWYTTIDKLGAIITAWPVKSSQLPAWLRERAASMGLRLGDEAIQLLAQRTEGSLGAAHQALQRLQLLSDGDTSPDYDTVAQIATDMSQISVFELIDSALAQDVQRCVHLLGVLRKQNTQPLLILNSVLREIRLLAASYDSTERGTSLSAALQGAGVWKNRMPLMRQAYQRNTANSVQNLFRLAHRVDNSAKGAHSLSPWQVLDRLLLRLAGVNIPV